MPLTKIAKSNSPLWKGLVDVPSNWTISTVGDECRIGSGGTPSRRKPEYFEGDIPWIKSTELDLNVIVSAEEHITERALEESSARMYPKGTLLIAMYGLEAKGTRGRCAILGIEAAVNQACTAIQSFGRVHIPFLFYYYQSLGDRIMSLASGTKRQNLSIETIKSIPIPIPPMMQQQEIAAFLSKVDQWIALTEDIVKLCGRAKIGLMQRLLTRGIGHTKFKKTKIGEIPERWDSLKLKDGRISSKLQAGGTPRRSTQEYFNGEIRFAKIEDITSSGKYLATTQETITKSGLENSSAWLVPSNSILYSMYASYGEVVINTIPVAANQAILAIIPSDSIDLNYLYYALLSMKPKLRKYLRQTTQKNLNAHIVRNLEIPVPPPSEQKQISRILSTLDERTSSEEKCLYSLGQLKKGLMQVLLTGKVRVGA